MKHFLIAVTVAVLALVVFEITQTDAQEDCPPLDNSVTCGMLPGMIFQRCQRRCVSCYGSEQPVKACYTNFRCTCMSMNSTTDEFETRWLD
ncbi:unnamed protein product [Orchesella dallaii]|uniref:Uncharacterized protein n=1 Tax=Orchesella dallaii TaxID=48710 RepID=A0ABP1RWJ9_9HEXA